VRLLQEPRIGSKEQTCEYSREDHRHQKCLDHVKKYDGCGEKDEKKGGTSELIGAKSLLPQAGKVVVERMLARSSRRRPNFWS
jgi:hypothetical protein